MNKSSNRIPIDHLPSEAGVYKITCTATNECYVGGSANVKTRASQHVTGLAYGNHYSKPMLARYAEHGHSAFQIEVLDVCDVSELSGRETAWIQKLSPTFNTNKRAGEIRNPKDFRPVAPKARKSKRDKIKPARITKAQRVTERDDKILAAVSGGADPYLVASEMGIGVGLVRAALSKIGTTPGRIQRAKRNAAILAMLQGGKEIKDVATEFRCSYPTVYSVAAAHGIHRPRGLRKGYVLPATASQVAVTRQQWESVDWTKQDITISRELLVSRERVRQVRKLLGKPRSPRFHQRTLSVA